MKIGAFASIVIVGIVIVGGAAYAAVDLVSSVAGSKIERAEKSYGTCGGRLATADTVAMGTQRFRYRAKCRGQGPPLTVAISGLRGNDRFRIVRPTSLRLNGRQLRCTVDYGELRCAGAEHSGVRSDWQGVLRGVVSVRTFKCVNELTVSVLARAKNRWTIPMYEGRIGRFHGC